MKPGPRPFPARLLTKDGRPDAVIFFSWGKGYLTPLPHCLMDKYFLFPPESPVKTTITASSGFLPLSIFPSFAAPARKVLDLPKRLLKAGTRRVTLTRILQLVFQFEQKVSGPPYPTPRKELPRLTISPPCCPSIAIPDFFFPLLDKVRPLFCLLTNFFNFQVG